MEHKIIKLNIDDFAKCSNIWDMRYQHKLAEQFHNELQTGNRITYVYTVNDEFIGEISLVFDMNDNDYTIAKKRAYVSRLIVKPEFRRQGIGRKLVDFITEEASRLGFSELSIGVDIDNFAALQLYVNAGFDTIIFIGADEQGKYLKLLKVLQPIRKQLL